VQRLPSPRGYSAGIADPSIIEKEERLR
jgi:hypothetical protein